MSVLVVVTFQGDQEVFKKSLIDRADEYRQWMARSRQVGAIHHQFGLFGLDKVLVCDEWESAEKFNEFFSDPALQKFISEVGASTSVPPEMTMVEIMDSPDRF
jgi:hypothetical protein